MWTMMLLAVWRMSHGQQVSWMRDASTSCRQQGFLITLMAAASFLNRKHLHGRAYVHSLTLFWLVSHYTKLTCASLPSVSLDHRITGKQLESTHVMHLFHLLNFDINIILIKLASTKVIALKNNFGSSQSWLDRSNLPRRRSKASRMDSTSIVLCSVGHLRYDDWLVDISVLYWVVSQLQELLSSDVQQGYGFIPREPSWQLISIAILLFLLVSSMSIKTWRNLGRLKFMVTMEGRTMWQWRWAWFEV